MNQNNDTLMFEIFDSLNAQDSDSVRQVLETLYNGVMRLERQRNLGTQPYERSSERKGYANGYKSKTLNTRMGSLAQVRRQSGKNRLNSMF